MKLGFIKSNSTDSRHAGIKRQSLYSCCTDPSFKGISLLAKPVQKIINKDILSAGDGLLMHTLEDFTSGAKGTRFSKMIKVAPEALNDVVSGKAKEVTVEFSEPSVLAKLLESLTYPFKDMWLDIGNAACNGLKKIPGLKDSGFITGVQNSKPFKNHRIKKELTDLLYQATGMAETITGNETNGKFLGAFNKALDKPHGNYNTKFERTLNRLSTGLISASFVGKDFYNISMYQKNDKAEALKSEKKRFNQEVKRFSLTAFISFVTLGALAKYTNKSRSAAVGVLVGTAFVSEILSRITGGVPLVPLTPKQAKEINEKRLQKEKQKESQKQMFKGTVSQDSNIQKATDAPNAEISADKNKTIEENKANVQKDKKAKKPMNKQLKVLLNITGAVVGGGFALAVGRKYLKGFDKECAEIATTSSAIYKKITQKTVWASQDNVNKFVDKLEESGHKSLASKYRVILAEEGVGAIRDGKAVYNLGKKDAWWGCFPLIVKKALGVVKGPYKLFANILKGKQGKVQNKIAQSVASSPDMKTLSELYRRGSKKMDSGAEFKQTMDKTIRDTFNSGTKSQYSNTSLAMISRTFITLIASYFFVNDFRNKVLIDSNGEDIERAREVTNTRIGHKVVNFFTNTFWMALFNNVFEKAYLGSLVGATAVATATELCNESTIRKSIGVPTKRMGSREEIEKFEDNAYNNKGFYGNWIRFVSRATGKKRLSEKAKEEAQKAADKKAKAKA